MRGQKVDAASRSASAQAIQVTAAAQAVGKLGDLARVTLPELAHVVAVFAIPFAPQHRQVADLVTEVADVPWLGDELGAREHWILVNDVEEGGARIVAIRLAPQRDSQIEAEPVDVHLLDPVAQAVGDQLEHL